MIERLMMYGACILVGIVVGVMVYVAQNVMGA